MKRISTLTCLLHTAIVISALPGIANAAAAQDSPIVRATVTPSEVSVGEPVTLQVTVLAPTWFPSPPGYPSFELANAVTRLPPDSSYPTNERINGETWSGIVRRYQIHPLLGATYRLTRRTMRVTYAHPQSFRPFTVEVEVPDTEFRAVVPAGAEALDPYLAGTSLKLEREIAGEIVTLQAGDALVVQYTATLEGLPAIFLPDLAGQTPIAGVSAYLDEPVIEDVSEGSGRARRSERQTLVFETGGDFSVPGIELVWWNTRSREVETASVPPFMVSVAGPVPIPTDSVPTITRPPGNALVAVMWVVAGALGIMLLVRLAPTLHRGWNIRQQRRQQSEAYAFARLRNALRTDDAGAAHRALLIWLARLEPAMDTRQFAYRFGNAELQAQTEGLTRALYSGATEVTDLQGLADSLVAARRGYLRQLGNHQPFALPTLNP